MHSLPGLLLIALGLFVINVGLHGAGLLPIQDQTVFQPATGSGGGGSGSNTVS